MYQNYVVEIKQNFNGELEHQIYWLWDENQTKALRKAEARIAT